MGEKNAHSQEQFIMDVLRCIPSTSLNSTDAKFGSRISPHAVTTAPTCYVVVLSSGVETILKPKITTMDCQEKKYVQ